MISKEFLIKQYLEELKSAEDIAKEVGCTPQNVWYHLKKHQIPTRSKSEVAKLRYRDKSKHPRWKDGRWLKSYCCRKCGNKVSNNCFLYGSGLCKSCAVTGSFNPSWKDGKRTVGGYIYIYDPLSKNRGKRRANAEHRVVVEKFLKRLLYPNEIIHHINGVKNDNRLENLVVVTRQTHDNNTLLKISQRRIRELEKAIYEKNL